MNGQLGRYELVRKIAAGGMAEIFLARQWGEGGFFRDVVIKRLFRDLAVHESVLRKFQYEALLLAHLCHPNIPQVLDLGFADGTWYLAMEYVEGHNVADVWRAGSRTGQVMPLPVSIGIVMQVCEALHHAHERHDKAGVPLRIVHRDVTPHNVMLTRDGVVKLMDFGVARTAARADTELGSLKGTLSYMAPEQVRGKPLDRRADVFALGVILYELTTGTRLFRGSDMEIMLAIVERDAPRPSTRVSGYPQELELVVMSALARVRGRRLRSAAHMAMALEQFAQRYGMLVGPRGVARYLGQVLPAETVHDARLGMVNAPPPTLESPYTPVPLVDVDEPTPAPLPAPARPVSFESVEAQLAGVAIEPLAGFEESVPDSGELDLRDTLPPSPLDGFEDSGPVERPVVLLQKPKRRPPDEAQEGDYVNELERRMHDEPED